MKLTEKLSEVVRVLDRHDKTMAQAMVCLGASPKQVVSVVFVIPKQYEFGDLDRYRRLLAAGAMGTPRHGCFDLALVFDDCVWVRTQDCLGFTRSKQPRKIHRDLIKSTVPWPRWRQEIELVERPKMNL